MSLLMITIANHYRQQVISPSFIIVTILVITTIHTTEVLCTYFIIVTTHKRLSSEWRKKGLYDCSYVTVNGDSSRGVEVSPLLGLVFFRIAFDEGHSFGKSNLSNSLLMASSIHAKNRWLLTGTPTPSDTTQSLSYLFHQFEFLSHPIFNIINSGTSTTMKGENLYMFTFMYEQYKPIHTYIHVYMQ